MEPASAALTLLGLLKEYGPVIYAKGVELLHKKDPTRADYDAIFDKDAALDYEKSAADAQARAAIAPTPVP